MLCEKPFATSPADAARCFDAAEAAGRVVVEGFMWRHHPQTILARRLVADGAIGRLSTIRAALTVDVPPGDIRRSPALGGGALYDLGCYCVSAARLFGGHPTRVWAEPVMDQVAGPDGGVDLRLDGAWGLTGEEADAYRIEFDVVSAAVAAGDPTSFGRADAVGQAAVIEAVARSAATGLPVEPPPSAAGPGSSSGHPPEPLAGPSDPD